MFFIGVYRDQKKAKECIAALRSFYDDDPILSIADGTKDIDYSSFCLDTDVRYYEGARLKLQKFGGLWTERYLEEFIDSGERFVVKLDPDTEVLRKVEKFPDAEVFCQFKRTHAGTSLAGAAIGWSRAAAEKVLQSKLLRDGEYTKNIYAYHRFTPPMLKPGEELEHNPIALQDEILTDVCKRLALRVKQWPDVSLENKSSAFYHEFIPWQT
jgi:hypothetical protein